MYDRETVSLWIHTTGEAVVGDYKGQSLKFLPSTVTTWKSWREEYPKTLVLNVRKGRDPRFELKARPKTGGISVGDPGGELKFYPLPHLLEQHMINDRIGTENVVVTFDPERWAFAAFARDDRTFNWKDGKLVDATGKEWNPLTGVSGEQSLKRLPAVMWLRSAWMRFYPDGDIYAD